MIMILSCKSVRRLRILTAALSAVMIFGSGCSSRSNQILKDNTPSASPQTPLHEPTDNITARLPLSTQTEAPAAETKQPDKTEQDHGINNPPETQTKAETAPESDSDILARILSKKVPKAKTEAEYSENGELPTALMYHLIMETPYNDYSALFVRPDDWDEQLTALTEAGCTFLFANDYRRTEGKSVIVSFDDGYEDNYTTMFPILKAHGAKASVFLISDMIGTPGYLTEDQIREMAQSGLVYFGCHTASHCNLATVSENAVRKEYTRSIKKIEELTGQPCNALAYPAGKYNDTVIGITKEFFDFAYLARNTVSDEGITPFTIPRVYVSRGTSAASLAARFK